jgi:ABC-type antimicrobial peptide transport system permease subunit
MRMALGAQPGTVIGMVLSDGFRLLSIGLILGLMGAFFCAQLLESVLYGVSPHDPPTFALVPVLLIAVGLLACYLPTRRVTRIDPNSAIRCE